MLTMGNALRKRVNGKSVKKECGESDMDDGVRLIGASVQNGKAQKRKLSVNMSRYGSENLTPDDGDSHLIGGFAKKPRMMKHNACNKPLILQHPASKVKFTCQRCQENFSSEDMYYVHVKKKLCIFFNNAQHCPVCPSIFNFGNLFREHLDAHRKNRVFCKQSCGVSFETLNECEDHEVHDHLFRKYECYICWLRFRTYSALLDHKQTHRNFVHFVCSFCRRWFAEKSLLDKHWVQNANSCGRLMLSTAQETTTRNTTTECKLEKAKRKQYFDKLLVSIKEEPIDGDVEPISVPSPPPSVKSQSSARIKIECSDDEFVSNDIDIKLGEILNDCYFTNNIQTSTINLPTIKTEEDTSLLCEQKQHEKNTHDSEHSYYKVVPDTVKTPAIDDENNNSSINGTHQQNSTIDSTISPSAAAAAATIGVRIIKLSPNMKIIPIEEKSVKISPTKNNKITPYSAPFLTNPNRLNILPSVEKLEKVASVVKIKENYDSKIEIDKQKYAPMVVIPSSGSFKNFKNKVLNSRSATDLKIPPMVEIPISSSVVKNFPYNAASKDISKKPLTMESRLSNQSLLVKKIDDEPAIVKPKNNKVTILHKQNVNSDHTYVENVEYKPLTKRTHNNEVITISNNKFLKSQHMKVNKLEFKPVIEKPQNNEITAASNKQYLKLKRTHMDDIEGKTVAATPQNNEVITTSNKICLKPKYTTVKEQVYEPTTEKPQNPVIKIQNKLCLKPKHKFMGNVEDQPAAKNAQNDSISISNKQYVNPKHTSYQNCTLKMPTHPPPIVRRLNFTTTNTPGNQNCKQISKEPSGKYVIIEKPPTTNTILKDSNNSTPDNTNSEDKNKTIDMNVLQKLLSESLHRSKNPDADRKLCTIPKTLINAVNSLPEKREIINNMLQQIQNAMTPPEDNVIGKDDATMQTHDDGEQSPSPITVTVEMKHICPHCREGCSSKLALSNHIRSECGQMRVHKCHVCSKKFSSSSTLRVHLSVHTGELPFQCKYCDRFFRTRGQVNVHHRRHTGERPFQCRICSQAFTHRETLISHLSRHIGMRRYKCYGCNSSFSCISGLKMHRNSRPNTCGKFELNSRAIGPRVRVVRGNVVFEPQSPVLSDTLADTPNTNDVQM